MRNVKWWEEANTSTSTKPVLVQMTRQRVWENGVAESDSRGKKEIKEMPFFTLSGFFCLWIKSLDLNLSTRGMGAAWGKNRISSSHHCAETMNKGYETREFPPSLLFQMHVIIFRFVFLPSAVSPWASFAVVSHPLLYRPAMWLVVLKLVSLDWQRNQSTSMCASCLMLMSAGQSARYC